MFERINNTFQPDAYVVQCGADSLVGDPLGGFNLTPGGMKGCIELILKSANEKPCLFLGGGGYDRANAARYWAILTSIIIGYAENDKNNLLPNDIPDNPFFHLYGPSFELKICKGLRKNENKNDEIQNVMDTIQLTLTDKTLTS